MAAYSPTLASRAVRTFILGLFRLRGWKLEGAKPDAKRFIIIGAPHTSNWDFVSFLGMAHQFGISPHFMGKASLFRWPLGRFMFDMGGVPVDRSKRGNHAEAMAAAFAEHEEFTLVIAPEGTRSHVGKWRSGFWHIAKAAGVPIVLAWVNVQTRRGGLGPAIMPGESFEADMKRIAAFYHAVMPGHPKWAAFNAAD